MKKSNDPVETVINPAAQAEAIREEPIPKVDQFLADEDGKRLLPEGAKSREELRALQLGGAAAHSTYAKDLTDGVSPPARTHAGKEAWLEATEPRRDLGEQRYEKEAQTWSSTKEVPHNSIDPQRRAIAKAAKAGFVIGDTAVLADQLYRSGTPLWLGLLVGLSLAVTVVMVGTQAGHEVAAALHRTLRGEMPAGALVGVRALYESGDELLGTTFWMRMAYVAGGCMFLALLMLGVGSGDPKSLALGYAFLGALTVLGSACAEAYATNEAADHLKATEVGMESLGNDLKAFEEAERDSAAEAITASLADAAARHTAMATNATVTATANRLPDSPDVGGYIESDRIPAPDAPPAPDKAPVIVTKSQPAGTPRSRKRSSRSLQATRPPVEDTGSGAGIGSDYQPPAGGIPDVSSNGHHDPVKADGNATDA